MQHLRGRIAKSDVLLFSVPLEHVCPFRADPRSAPRSVFRDLYCKSRRYKRGAERGTDAPRRVYTYDFTVRISRNT